MLFCAAYRCFNNEATQNLTFFRFPVKKELRDKWLKFCPDDYKANKDSHLCSAHFDDYSYEEFFYNVLKPNACPTLLCRKSEKKEQLAPASPELFYEVEIGDPEELPLAPSMVDGLCRLCAKSKLSLVPIFDNIKESFLEGIINRYLPIQVSRSDMLPLVVCSQCVTTMTSYNKLHTDCIIADETLRSLLSLPLASYSKIDGGENVKLEKNVESTSGFRGESGDNNVSIGDLGKCKVEEDVAGEEVPPVALKSSKKRRRELEDDFMECQNCKCFFLNANFKIHQGECTEKETPSTATEVVENKIEKPKKRKWNIDTKALMAMLQSVEIPKPRRRSTVALAKEGRSDVGDTCFSGQNENPLRLNDNVAEIKRYKCDECTKAFKKEFRLKEHKVRGCSPNWQCIVCGLKFLKSSSMKRHLLTHRETDANVKFSCDKCPSSFKRKGDLREHILSHSKDRRYKCEVCAKSYKNWKPFSNHRKVLHQIQEKSPAFMNLECLQTSLALPRRHSSTSKYACKKCGKQFTLEGVLKVHEAMGCFKEKLKTISKERNCKICGITCQSPHARKIHLQVCHSKSEHNGSSSVENNSGQNHVSNGSVNGNTTDDTNEECTCEVCGVVCDSWSTKIAHARTCQASSNFVEGASLTENYSDETRVVYQLSNGTVPENQADDINEECACEICGVTYDSWSTKKAHERTCQGSSNLVEGAALTENYSGETRIVYQLTNEIVNDSEMDDTNGEFTCEICGVACDSWSTKTAHERTCQGSSNVVESTSTENYLDETQVVYHLASEAVRDNGAGDTNVECICGVCGMSCDSWSTKIAHERTCQGSSNLVESTSTENYLDETQVVYHLASEGVRDNGADDTNVECICGVCGASCDSWSTKIAHERTCQASSYFVEGASLTENYSDETRVVYQLSNGTVTENQADDINEECACEICGVTCDSWSTKISHERTCQGNSNLVESTSFTDDHSVLTHAVCHLTNGTVNESDTNGECTCEICGVTCDSRPTKIAHERTCRWSVNRQNESADITVNLEGNSSPVEKAHSCNTCGKQFRRRESLESHHIRKHTDRDPYECRYCGRGFAHRKKMKKHQLKHEVESRLSATDSDC